MLVTWSTLQFSSDWSNAAASENIRLMSVHLQNWGVSFKNL